MSVKSVNTITEEKNVRILAELFRVSNDTRKSGLNNNDCIIGPSGSGKTGGYVIPNLMQAESSVVVADTKGNLHRKLAGALKSKGFRVHVIDFTSPEKSGGYNPLNYIGTNPKTFRYSEKDIMSISTVLCPTKVLKDPFWEEAARNVIACLISFVMDAFPPKEQNLCSVVKVFRLLCRQYGEQKQPVANIPFMEEWLIGHPESLAAKKYLSFRHCMSADRTWNCIQQFVSNALEPFALEDTEEMLKCTDSFRIERLGERKTVLFLNVSDTDRAQDTLVNLFYTQALSVLCREADRSPESRLNVPVRLILDDFATNAIIPDFDKLISVIRSREISVSIILQSLTQLDGMYGHSKAMTIINNCDHLLYLGGTDLGTVDYISRRVNLSAETIMSLPLDKVYVLERGRKGLCTDKFKPYSVDIPIIEEEPDYPEDEEDKNEDDFFI